MRAFMAVLDSINTVMWHDFVLYFVLAVGVLFTVWTRFGQYRALTHGVAAIRGKFDRKEDPGAINHFQALSAALSATVGLGNIAGVAIALAVGGPGAVFWMWVIGFVGMALKMTEVTQAMLYRNLEDPENPHGGAMWVCKKGFSRLHPSLGKVGTAVGGLFCITLLISTITGGNMFQAWNVADICSSYFGIPEVVTGIVMTLMVGLVIIGGIKRIGSVAGRLVPFMCVLYLLAGLYVIGSNIGRVPDMFRLIFQCAFSRTEAQGAFLGGTFGFAFLKGMQRALFSNEAGQGSAPIAHCAAKTDEPVREGVVAGLEPFVDTLVVCTVTAVVILLSGVWSREPALRFDTPAQVTQVEAGGQGLPVWSLESGAISIREDLEAKNQMNDGQEVFAVVDADTRSSTGQERHRLAGRLHKGTDGNWTVNWSTMESRTEPRLAIEGVYFDFKGATLTAKAFDFILPGLGLWIVPATVWLFAISTMISWSYYGEQGVVYLWGTRAVMAYRVIYCLFIFAATSPLIATEYELDVISTLGTGVMLWVNIPIMLLFGKQAMGAYRTYMRKLDAGEFHGRKAYPSVTDVVEGKDIR
jgi:AGCS family alanine or glycine:cation symporter